jgi:hypothetical protein
VYLPRFLGQSHPGHCVRFTPTTVKIFSAFAASLLLGSCVRITWRDRALQERPAFDSPELCFETFRAAIRCDDPLLGYATISEAMKKRESIDSFTFSIGWEEFFRRFPFARLAGNAEIESAERINARRAVVRANAHGHAIRMDLVRQDYFEINVEGSAEPIDAFIPSIAEHLEIPKNQENTLRVKVSNEKIIGLTTDRVTSIVFAGQWKIFALAEVNETETAQKTKPNDPQSNK